MRLKDCLTHDGATARNAEGLVVNRKDMDESSEGWEPLMSESEWRARHPLALRKLGEGETFKEGRQYLPTRPGGTTWFAPVTIHSTPIPLPNWRYYELPPLPPAESEPTPFEEGKAILRELVDSAVEAHGEQILEGVDPAVQRVLGEPAPAPNSVGERLTSEPSNGVWVVRFRDNGRPLIFPWGPDNSFWSDDKLYRWLGPIPQEPTEPEKPEPPKESVADAFKQVCDALESFSDEERRRILRSAAIIMVPPTPELAKLFGEEEGQ